MRISLEIAAPGKQGAPAHDLPFQKAPTLIDPQLPPGGVIYRERMAVAVSLVGAETVQTRYSAKWAEASPLAAVSNGATYAGTAAPTDTLPKVTVSAYELDPRDTGNGAVRLRNLLAWLAFCTQPFTKLGRPPLLRVRFGFFDAYGYLTAFDPHVTEWMLDDRANRNTGLPYEATFALTLQRETLGLAALELKTGLPSSQDAPGGAGGLGAAKVNMPGHAPLAPAGGR